MKQDDDKNDEEYKFQSGWDYLKKEHLGTMIVIGIILVFIGYSSLSYILPQQKTPDCAYTDTGCNESDTNRFWP